MTHSTKARSIVEDSISIKGGIFYPTAVWEKKKRKKEITSPRLITKKKMLGEKRLAGVERGGHELSKDVGDGRVRPRCSRTTLLEVSYTQTFIHWFFCIMEQP